MTSPGQTPSRRERDACENLILTLEQAGHRTLPLLEQRRPGRPSRRLLLRLMGHLARAGGPVQKGDIAYAEQVMAECRVSSRERRRLIRAFRQGKTLEEPRVPLWFRIHHRWRPEPGLRLLACLIPLCQTPAGLSPARTLRCEQIAEAMGIDRRNSLHLMDSFHQKRAGNGGDRPRIASLAEACRLLGETRSASYATLKKAYRRQVSQYHPDKQLGQSPATQAAARDRLHQLQLAWEVIERHHR